MVLVCSRSQRVPKSGLQSGSWRITTRVVACCRQTRTPPRQKGFAFVPVEKHLSSTWHCCVEPAYAGCIVRLGSTVIMLLGQYCTFYRKVFSVRDGIVMLCLPTTCKLVRGTWGMAPLILNLDSRHRWVVSFTLLSLYRQERTPVLCVGPREILNSFWEEKIFSLWRDSNPR